MSHLLDYLLAQQEAMTRILSVVMPESPAATRRRQRAGKPGSLGIQGGWSVGGTPAAGCVWRSPAHLVGAG